VFGSMLEGRCCCRAVPSQVNKLHTKHEQSVTCLAPLGGRVLQGVNCPPEMGLSPGREGGGLYIVTWRR
jgi:hypothetical protein